MRPDSGESDSKIPIQQSRDEREGVDEERTESRLTDRDEDTCIGSCRRDGTEK